MRLFKDIRKVELFFVCVAIVALSIIFHSIGKTLFGDIQNDGFYEQLVALNNAGWHAVKASHFIRYVVVYPFLWFGNVVFDSMYFYILLAPVFLSLKENKMRFLSYLLPFMSIFLSYRVFLLNIAICYIFLGAFKYASRLLVLLGIFFSCLSSGVLLLVGALLILNHKSMLMLYSRRWYIFFLLSTFALLLPSIYSKIDFYLNHNFRVASNTGGGIVEFYVSRNCYLNSFLLQKWGKLTFFVAMLIASIIIHFSSKKEVWKENFSLSFVLFPLSGLLEGAGISSGLLVVIMFFLGFRPRQC